MLKYLRIAVTALSLTACGLLVALWVRSYTWLDSIAGRGGGGNSVSIFRGSVFINPGGFTFTIDDPNFNSSPSSSRKLLAGGRIHIFNQTGFADLEYETQRKGWTFPMWLLVAASVVVAALPWLPWWSNRFSLRTLLIVTALVAVGLGIVIALS